MCKTEKYMCWVYLVFTFIRCILGGMMATVSLLALIQLIVFLNVLIFAIRKICQNKDDKSMRKSCGESYLYQRYLILLTVAQILSNVLQDTLG